MHLSQRRTLIYENFLIVHFNVSTDSRNVVKKKSLFELELNSRSMKLAFSCICTKVSFQCREMHKNSRSSEELVNTHRKHPEKAPPPKVDQLGRNLISKGKSVASYNFVTFVYPFVPRRFTRVNRLREREGWKISLITVYRRINERFISPLTQTIKKLTNGPSSIILNSHTSSIVWIRNSFRDKSTNSDDS